MSFGLILFKYRRWQKLFSDWNFFSHWSWYFFWKI